MTKYYSSTMTPDCLVCLSTVEIYCICRHNMERGSFFKSAQICLLSVEVKPNLMDKSAHMGAGVNGK